MKIIFASGLNAWEDFNIKVQELIVQNQYKKIAEIGGGPIPYYQLIM